jgi:hypothetical protein
MRRMKRSIREYDIFWWVDSFMNAAFTRDLSDFPAPTDSMEELAESSLPF